MSTPPDAAARASGEGAGEPGRVVDHVCGVHPCGGVTVCYDDPHGTVAAALRAARAAPEGKVDAESHLARWARTALTGDLAQGATDPEGLSADQCRALLMQLESAEDADMEVGAHRQGSDGLYDYSGHVYHLGAEEVAAAAVAAIRSARDAGRKVIVEVNGFNALDFFAVPEGSTVPAIEVVPARSPTDAPAPYRHAPDAWAAGWNDCRAALALRRARAAAPPAGGAREGRTPPRDLAEEARILAASAAIDVSRCPGCGDPWLNDPERPGWHNCTVTGRVHDLRSVAAPPAGGEAGAREALSLVEEWVRGRIGLSHFDYLTFWPDDGFHVAVDGLSDRVYEGWDFMEAMRAVGRLRAALAARPAGEERDDG